MIKLFKGFMMFVIIILSLPFIGFGLISAFLFGGFMGGWDTYRELCEWLES